MAAKLTAIRAELPISKSIVLDISALIFIYFVPALSHFANVPLFLVEPMRIMLIFAIAHATHRNAYIIALTLPFFSFLVSGHPVFFNTVIMTVGLLANIWLFYFLSTKWKNYFVAMLVSIIISKALYYVMKFGLINFQIIEAKMIVIPIYLQVISMILFSIYIFSVLSRREVEPPRFVDPTRDDF